MSAARRKAWVGWIPAAILAALVLGAGVTAAVLINSGLGGPAPRPTAGQVTELNWSSFTEEGLDYIAVSRQVRIDLSRAPVDAAALGLAADDILVLERIDTGDTMLDYDLIVNGAGEFPGGIRLVASEVEIETAGGVVVAVRATVPEVLVFRDALARLEGQADTYGWTVDRDALFEQVDEATRADEPFEIEFGPADRVGIAVRATASCDASGFCGIAYEIAPR